MLWGFCPREDGNRIRTIGALWCSREKRRDSDGGKDGGRKFPEGYTFPLRIKCPTPTLSAALMWKWPLNSNFTVSSPFHHLQQSFDGTSILRVPCGVLGKKEGIVMEARMVGGSFLKGILPPSILNALHQPYQLH